MTESTNTAFSSEVDWEWLRAEVDRAALGFCASLAKVDNGSVPVPGLTWSAGQLGAHLVSIPEWYRESIAAPKPFVMPADTGANTLRLLEAVGTTDIAQLADRLIPAIGEFFDEWDNDGDAEVDWYLPSPLWAVAAAFLAELIFHRMDLARITGEDIAMTREQAVAASRGLFPVSEVLVDREVARTCNGTIHVRLRGGDDWTIRIEGETARVTLGKPEKADWHNIVDPVTMIGVGYGRVNPIKAALTGKIWGYGRKPMLAVRSQELFKPL